MKNTAVAKIAGTVALATLIALPGIAQAANSGMHHAQSGALIQHAEKATLVLNAAFNERQFDLDFTNRVVTNLEATLAATKKHVDRTSTLLDEKQSKLEPDFEKLRADIVAAEAQVSKLKSDLETTVKPFMEQEDAGDAQELGSSGEAGSVPEPNWDSLKNYVAWIYQDVTAAKKKHGKLGRKVKGPRMKAPKKPKGARP